MTVEEILFYVCGFERSIRALGRSLPKYEFDPAPEVEIWGLREGTTEIDHLAFNGEKKNCFSRCQSYSNGCLAFSCSPRGIARSSHGRYTPSRWKKSI